MADVGTSIRQYIVSKASVNSLISSRMYPDELPQNAMIPAVIYRRIATSHFETIEGSKAGLAQATIEVTCFAVSRQSVNELCEAIRLCGILDIQGVTNGVNIRSTRLVGGRRDYTDPPIDGTHQLRYVAGQDYLLTYVEEV